ncbi:hypothetical protein M2R47_07545 [Moraxella sp. Tifton1]|nr:hypothetical protein [Moraxella sp. Tifton1]MCL1624091.1 hypothetical protein [Moraxella sp. Tifton1]
MTPQRAINFSIITAKQGGRVIWRGEATAYSSALLINQTDDKVCIRQSVN